MNTIIMPIYTYATLVLTMLLWGGAFIAGRALAATIEPATAAFIRFAIATIALAFFTYLVDGKLSLPPRKQWLGILLLGLTGVFSYNILFFTGLQYIEAGRASLIIALNPLVITLFATLFLHESLSLRQFCGVILSLTGAVYVISNGNPGQILSGSFGRGELAILGCVISWSTYSLIGRAVLSTLSPLASVFYSSLIGTLLLLWPAQREGILHKIPAISLPDWTILLFLGFFATALGFSLYYQAIKKIGASRASVFINLVPLFSIILSWVILGESAKPLVITGGIILLTGVSLTNYRGKKDRTT
ncbi:MAG: DMT family transporter [Desulfocapsa sp.]|nr:DMT family transporter [Desulfocapsa sp.]